MPKVQYFQVEKKSNSFKNPGAHFTLKVSQSGFGTQAVRQESLQKGWVSSVSLSITFEQSYQFHGIDDYTKEKDRGGGGGEG